LRNILVSAVRDTAEQLATINPAQVPRLIAILEQRPWRVFHRIALHLLRIFPDVAPALIVKRLTDWQKFDDPGFRHEYALLVRDRFAHLLPDEQAKILEWIAAGPNMNRMPRLGEESGQRGVEEQLTGVVKHWRRDWLALLRHALPAEWQQQYTELITALG